MLFTISLLILAYLIMGKDISGLLDKVKNVDWRGKINALEVLDSFYKSERCAVTLKVIQQE